MPSREYSKSKYFLMQSNSLADVLSAQYLELKTSPGRIRNRLPSAWEPRRSKVASETPKTKDTGLVPSHRISELMGALGIILLKKEKEKKKRGEYGSAKREQC